MQPAATESGAIIITDVARVCIFAGRALEWFLAHKEHTAVLIPHHRARVLGVWGWQPGLFFQEYKAQGEDDVAHVLIAWLNGVLVWQVGVVVQQWAQVDPEAARPQAFRYRLNVQNHIWRCVQEKTRRHTVPLLRLRAVHLDEVSRRHGELGLGGHLAGVGVREAGHLDLVGRRHVVVVLVHPGVHAVQVCPLAAVEDEVGGEEHEEAELIALAAETLPGNLEGEPPKTRSRHQNVDAAWIYFLQWVVLRYSIQDWLEASFPLLCTFRAPLPNKLLQHTLHFVHVQRRSLNLSGRFHIFAVVGVLKHVGYVGDHQLENVVIVVNGCSDLVQVLPVAAEHELVGGW